MKIYTALIFLILTGCASWTNKNPKIEVYRYSDLYNHHYTLTLKGGRIADTSRIHDSNGNEVEVLIRKYHENKVLSIDTIVGIKKDKGTSDSCNPKGDAICQRSTESILDVIRKETPKLRKTYNKYLHGSPFGGMVTLKLILDPEGNIKYLYLEGNTTGVHDFALDILKEVNKWKFGKKDDKEFDVVTVPFTFNQ